MMALCQRDWFADPSLCYDFWRNRGHIKANTLCTQIRCYHQVLPDHPLSWQEAQEVCVKHNGTLITLNSHEELQLLRMMLMQDVSISVKSLFIGLNQILVSYTKVNMNLHCNLIGLGPLVCPEDK